MNSVSVTTSLTCLMALSGSDGQATGKEEFVAISLRQVDELLVQMDSEDHVIDKIHDLFSVYAEECREAIESASLRAGGQAGVATTTNELRYRFLVADLRRRESTAEFEQSVEKLLEPDDVTAWSKGIQRFHRARAMEEMDALWSGVQIPNLEAIIADLDLDEANESMIDRMIETLNEEAAPLFADWEIWRANRQKAVIEWYQKELDPVETARLSVVAHEKQATIVQALAQMLARYISIITEALPEDLRADFQSRLNQGRYEAFLNASIVEYVASEIMMSKNLTDEVVAASAGVYCAFVIERDTVRKQFMDLDRQWLRPENAEARRDKLANAASPDDIRAEVRKHPGAQYLDRLLKVEDKALTSIRGSLSPEDIDQMPSGVGFLLKCAKGG